MIGEPSTQFSQSEGLLYTAKTDPPDYLSQNHGYSPKDLKNPLLKPLDGNYVNEYLLRFQDVISYLSNDGSKSFVGTLHAMCSNKEFNQKIQMNTANDLERNNEKQVHPILTLKSFQRSDASRIFKPEDVRPVIWCRRTLYNVLCHFVDVDVVKKPYLMDKNFTYLDVYNFLRDRIRSIWQDLTVQHCTRHRGYIECFEISIRFLIYSNEILCGNEEYDVPQNLVLLNTCLDKLMDGYADVHSTNNNKCSLKENVRNNRCSGSENTEILNVLTYDSPYEAEFWAYRLLLLIPQLLIPGCSATFCDICQRMPDAIKNNEMVKFSIQVCLTVSSGNIYSFFEMMKDSDCHPLQAALMNRFAGCMRVRFLHDIITHKVVKKTTNPMDLNTFNVLFGFVDEPIDNVKIFLSRYDITTTESGESVLIELDQANLEQLTYDNNHLNKISGKTQISSSIVQNKISSKFPSRQLVFDPDFEFPPESTKEPGLNTPIAQFICSSNEMTQPNHFASGNVNSMFPTDTPVNSIFQSHDTNVFKQDNNLDSGTLGKDVQENDNSNACLIQNTNVTDVLPVQCTQPTEVNNSTDIINANAVCKDDTENVVQPVNIPLLDTEQIYSIKDKPIDDKHKIHNLDKIMDSYSKKRAHRQITVSRPRLLPPISPLETSDAPNKLKAESMLKKSRIILESILSNKLFHVSELNQRMQTAIDLQTNTFNETDEIKYSVKCTKSSDEGDTFSTKAPEPFVWLSLLGSLNHLFRLYTQHIKNNSYKFIVPLLYTCASCGGFQGSDGKGSYFHNTLDLLNKFCTTLPDVRKLLSSESRTFCGSKRQKIGTHVERVNASEPRSLIGTILEYVNSIVKHALIPVRNQRGCNMKESNKQSGILLHLNLFETNTDSYGKMGNTQLESTQNYMKSDYCLRLKQDVLSICGLNIGVYDLIEGSSGYTRTTFEIYKDIVSHKSVNAVYSLPISISASVHIRKESDLELKDKSFSDSPFKVGKLAFNESAHKVIQKLASMIENIYFISNDTLVSVCSEPLIIGNDTINNLFLSKDTNTYKPNIVLPTIDELAILSFLSDNSSTYTGSNKNESCILCYRLCVSKLDMLTLYELFGTLPSSKLSNCKCFERSHSVCYNKLNELISDIDASLMDGLLKRSVGYNVSADAIKKNVTFACTGFELNLNESLNPENTVNTQMTKTENKNRMVCRLLYPSGFESALINILDSIE